MSDDWRSTMPQLYQVPGLAGKDYGYRPMGVSREAWDCTHLDDRIRLNARNMRHDPYARHFARWIRVGPDDKQDKHFTRLPLYVDDAGKLPICRLCPNQLSCLMGQRAGLEEVDIRPMWEQLKARFKP